MIVSTGIRITEGSYRMLICVCFLQGCQVPLLISDVTASVIESGEFLVTDLFFVYTEREVGGWISTNRGLTTPAAVQQSVPRRISRVLYLFKC